MPVSITINGDNAPQALAELGSFANGLLVKPVAQMQGLQAGAQLVTPSSGETVEGAGANKPAGRGRKAKTITEAASDEASTGQNISTGEERIEPSEQKDPEPPQTTEPATPPLTLDNVRNAANIYVEKFGMAAAKVDLQFALKEAVGVDKISALEGADQEKLKRAVDALTAAGEADKRYEPKAS